MSDMMTTGQAADRLSVTPQTIRGYLERGLLDGHTLPSGHRRITRDSVDRLRTMQEADSE